ncbi:MAG: inositol monophosphatase family protein [bacterium]|nr:inositol monophosphatase family protein [bacterium]
MSKIKQIAIEAVKKSGKMLILRYKRFDRADVMLKARHEILTKADLASEKIIIGEIRKNFPEHNIISEEAGSSKKISDYTWIIDPIDGTTNFSMHNPLWSISIAVAKNNNDKLEIVAGIVYAPMLDELYVAEYGKGAYLNGKKIKVSKINKGKVLNIFCNGKRPAGIKKAIEYYRKQKLAGFDCRQFGSAAIELSYLACGRVESFVAPMANDWDVAAGALLVREAGGVVTDFAGKEWRIGSGDVAASNGLAHQNILNILQTI